MIRNWARFLVPLTLSIAVTTGQVNAQQLPATDLWLIKLDIGQLAGARRIVHTGRYNNQPMFSKSGGSIFYTAEDVRGQTDIARFHLTSETVTVIHASPESEYSPTPIPGSDAVSVIRVELPDQRQRLWKIPLDGKAPSLLMPQVEPVGYHSWVDVNTAVTFILGETFDLHIANVGPGSSRLLVRNIGRTLRRHPLSGNMLFVDKNTEPWTISDINPVSGKISRHIDLLPGHEDFEVDSEGRYWMGSGGKLYRSSWEKTWWLIGDLSEFGVNHISRIAINREGNLLVFAASGE